MAKKNENKRNKPNSSEDMKYTAITIRDKPVMTTGMIIRRFLLYSKKPNVSWLVDFGFFITRMMLLMRRMKIIMRVQGPFENDLKQNKIYYATAWCHDYLKMLLLTYDLISCPVRYRIITPEPTVWKTKKSLMNLMLIKATAAVLDRPMTVESEMSANISPAKLLVLT